MNRRHASTYFLEEGVNLTKGFIDREFSSAATSSEPLVLSVNVLPSHTTYFSKTHRNEECTCLD